MSHTLEEAAYHLPSSMSNWTVLGDKKVWKKTRDQNQIGLSVLPIIQH